MISQSNIASRLKQIPPAERHSPAWKKLEEAIREVVVEMCQEAMEDGRCEMVYFRTLAKEQGISYQTIRRWFTEGRNGRVLPVHRVGSVAMISRREFDEFVAEAEKEPEIPRVAGQPALDELLGVI